MLVEATAAKDPARFHRKGKNRPYRDTRINPCVAMGVSQSPLADNLGTSSVKTHRKAVSVASLVALNPVVLVMRRECT